MFVLRALKEFHAPVLTPFFQILTAFWNPFLFFQIYCMLKLKKNLFLEAKLAGEEVTEIVLKLVGRVARYLLPATDRITVRY